MSAQRIVPILLLCSLPLAAFGYWLTGKNRQTFQGVIVLNFMTYEFYPDAKDCNYRGMPYVLLPNTSFHEMVASQADPGHLDRLYHGVWRAKINGNLSSIGWFKYRKTYLRELSVNYVLDAEPLSCDDER
jgi:hypothetical protein